MSSFPDFEQLVQQLSAAGAVHSPSELHGVICGLLATGHGHNDPELLGILAAHADVDGGLPDALAQALLAVRSQTEKGFTDDNLGLPMLLPGDEEELGVRVAAIGQWCEGFLVGFGTGSANTQDRDLAPGVQEALSDLAAISQIALPDEDGDAEEDMLEQIIDHCRMAALMIQTELVMGRKPASSNATPPTKH